MQGEKELEPKDETNIDNNALFMPIKVHLKTKKEESTKITLRIPFYSPTACQVKISAS